MRSIPKKYDGSTNSFDNDDFANDLLLNDPHFSFDMPQSHFTLTNSDPSAANSALALSPTPTSPPQDLPTIDLATTAIDRSQPASSGPDSVIEITSFETDFFAKGSAPGSGGGGGGSGGGSGGLYTNYYSGAANGTAGYDIWVEFKGTGWTTALQDAFIKSADYLTTVITDDIGGGGTYRGKVIDDLYVSAELKAIDGVGGILGQAGPTATWTSNDLTASGQMQFDSADAAAYLNLGLWDDIVTHEMMHVLGLGSLWNYGSHSLTTNYQYTGQNALDAYKSIDPNATFIPVENDGGSGTAGSHWDEQALGNELMTGYINNDGSSATMSDNYLSKFSVMSLADLGYQVNYSDYQYDGIAIM